MRVMSYALCAIVFFSLILPVEMGSAATDPVPIPTELHAGTQADPWIAYNSETLSMACDNIWTDTQLVRFDVKVQDSAGATVAEYNVQGVEKFPKDATQVKVPIRTMVEPLDNSLYQLTARVYDENGNVSAWSDPFWVRKTWISLEKPTGCILLR